MARNALIKLRRGIASVWSSVNPVLDDGEPGWDKTSGALKVGDGSTAWNSLPALGSGTYAPLPAATESILFVSRSAKASDSNDGLTPGSAKATVAGAVSALAGQPGTIRLGVGTFPAQNVTLYTNQVLEGCGPELTILQLPNGANTDVIVTDNFAALTNTGGTGGVTKTQVRELTVDGNRTNQTTGITNTPGSGTQALPATTITVGSTTGFASSGSFTVRSSSGMMTITYTGKTGTTFTGCSGGVGNIAASELVVSSGYGIRAYWYDSRIENVEIRNCVADGLWSEWGTGSGSSRATGAMESYFTRYKSYGNGRNGVTYLGPHDSHHVNYHLFANGRAGFFGNDSTYHAFGHTWGSPQLYGYDLYRATRVLESTAEVTNAAGSRGVRFGGSTQMTGSRFDGWVYAPPGSPYAGVGFEFGFTATAVDVNATIQDCVNGAFLFAPGTGGSGHRIKALVSQSTGPVFASVNTVVSSGSNNVDVSSFAGSGTLNILNSGNFSSTGAVLVQTSNGPQTVTYTGVGSGTLTGCSCSGSGVMLTGYPVTLIGYTNGQVHNDLSNMPQGQYDVTVTGGTTASGKTTADDVPLAGHGMRDGLESVSRAFGLVSSGGLTSGQVAYTYFTARKTRTVTTIKTRSRGTAAVGLTVAKVGLFSVASNGDLTLLAASTNDTTMWATTFTAYTKTIASTTLSAGQRYALGILAVGTTPPALYCHASGAAIIGEADLQPRIAAALSSQTDLTSVADSALAVGSGNLYYGILV